MSEPEFFDVYPDCPHSSVLPEHLLTVDETNLMYSTMADRITWFYDYYYRGWMPVGINEGTAAIRRPIGRIYWEQLRDSYQEQGFVVIPRLLSRTYAAYLALMFYSGPQERWNDMAGIRRTSKNDTPIMKLLHHQLAQMLSFITGKTLRPSYVFTAGYESGTVLPAHTDRPQCEYNVSLMLESKPSRQCKGWPLWLQVGETIHPAVLEEGDAVLYQGTKDRHWREAIPAHVSSVCGAFFHYVTPEFQGTLA